MKDELRLVTGTADYESILTLISLFGTPCAASEIARDVFADYFPPLRWGEDIYFTIFRASVAVAAVYF